MAPPGIPDTLLILYPMKPVCRYLHRDFRISIKVLSNDYIRRNGTIIRRNRPTDPPVSFSVFF